MPRSVTIPGCILDTVALNLIAVGTRFREDYGDLTDLKFSIKTQGLINPIAVMRTQEGSPTPFVLVAGGRRLKAFQELELDTIPVRIFEKFDPLTLRLLELAENLQRKDMTWQEQNRLQREIHTLQQQAHGVATSHNSGWRLEDTAQMLGVSKATISDSITLGEKLDKYAPVLGDPTKYKTENDARKAVKTVEEAMIRAELARRAEKRQSSNTFVQTMANNYILGDCLEGLSKIPDETFDFAEVDPPYGINLDKLKLDNDCEGYNEVAQDDYLVFTRDVLTRVYAKLKLNTYCLYWFGPDPWFEYIYRIAREVGFKGSRIPLVWTKPNGQSLNPSQTLATAYEAAFVFRKGSPVLAKPGRINVFAYQPLMPNKKFHPTQKPLELYQEIYNTFSFEGAKCVVPFVGSGASLIAAAMCKRQAVGWDLTEEFKGGYIQLVNETLLQSEGA